MIEMLIFLFVGLPLFLMTGETSFRPKDVSFTDEILKHPMYRQRLKDILNGKEDSMECKYCVQIT